MPYDTAELRDLTKLQNCNLTKLQNCDLMKLQNCDLMKLQNCDLIKLQNCDLTILLLAVYKILMDGFTWDLGTLIMSFEIIAYFEC